MMKSSQKPQKTILISIVLGAVLAAGGCKTPTTENTPAGHTVDMNGVYHRPGLYAPLTNCVSCHGADLKGGSVGISCYKCHGQVW
jgi:mono/diheme cytochrome c family protein